MIDLALKAIDRVIILLKGRVDDKRKFMQEQVSPIFSEMEIIHKNYNQSFSEIIKSIDHVEDLNELKNSILNKKMEFDHIRIKVISFAVVALRTKHVPAPAKNFFEESIKYLYRQSNFICNTEHRTDFSSLLHLLSNFDRNVEVEESKNRMRYEVENVINNSKAHWVKLTEEYSKCKLELLK